MTLKFSIPKERWSFDLVQTGVAPDRSESLHHIWDLGHVQMVIIPFSVALLKVLSRFCKLYGGWVKTPIVCTNNLVERHPFLHLKTIRHRDLKPSEYRRISCNRRKFRSQTSDNMQRWKSGGGKSQGGEVKKWEDQRRERVRSKKMQVRGKRRKVAIHCVFPMIWGSGGSKSNLAKAAGAEPAGQMRDEKVHAVVAWSTFPSQNCQKPTVSDHFRKLRCRKSARRCGAKHISKSKCTKHTMLRPLWKLRCRARRCGAKHISKSKCTQHEGFGPLLEVEMSKKWTLLLREAHFQVKSVKKLRVLSLFWLSDVEKVDAD